MTKIIRHRRSINYPDLCLVFEINNYYPRNNEYEKGLKYQIAINGYPIGHYFETIKAAKTWIIDNYWIYL